MPPFDPNENRALFPYGTKPSPTPGAGVAVGGVVGAPMPNGITSMKPLAKGAPTAAKELLRVNANANLATPIPRTKYGK